MKEEIEEELKRKTEIKQYKKDLSRDASAVN